MLQILNYMIYNGVIIYRDFFFSLLLFRLCSLDPALPVYGVVVHCSHPRTSLHLSTCEGVVRCLVSCTHACICFHLYAFASFSLKLKHFRYWLDAIRRVCMGALEGHSDRIYMVYFNSPKSIDSHALMYWQQNTHSNIFTSKRSEWKIM